MSRIRAEIRNTSIKNRLMATLHELVIVNVYWGTLTFIRRTFEQTSRALAYARFGYSNIDYDYTAVYRVMQFKLKRLQYALINGHAEHDPDSLAALQTAIKLTGRIARGRYQDIYYRAHDRKWGKRTNLLLDDKGFGKYRTNVYTGIDKKEALDDLRACYVKGERDRKADLDRLNDILKTYSTHWWD